MSIPTADQFFSSLRLAIAAVRHVMELLTLTTVDLFWLAVAIHGAILLCIGMWKVLRWLYRDLLDAWSR